MLAITTEPSHLELCTFLSLTHESMPTNTRMRQRHCACSYIKGGDKEGEEGEEGEQEQEEEEGEEVEGGGGGGGGGGGKEEGNDKEGGVEERAAPLLHR